MQEVSPNGDGRISPRDFGWWLFRGVSAEGFSHDPARLDSPGSDTAGDGNAQPHGDDAQRGRSAGQANTSGLWGDMVGRARQLLCLDCFDVKGLMEMLAEVAIAVSLVRMAPAPSQGSSQNSRNMAIKGSGRMPSTCFFEIKMPLFATYLSNKHVSYNQGTLALADFWRCMGYVLQLGGTAEGTVEWDEAFLLTERIHSAFEDDDGLVAFAAITCGTSILCQSSVEDKVGAGFYRPELAQKLYCSNFVLRRYVTVSLRT